MAIDTQWILKTRGTIENAQSDSSGASPLATFMRSRWIPFAFQGMAGLSGIIHVSDSGQEERLSYRVPEITIRVQGFSRLNGDSSRQDARVAQSRQTVFAHRFGMAQYCEGRQ